MMFKEQQTARLFSLLLVFVAGSTVRAASINYGDFIGANPGDVDFLQVTDTTTTDAVPLFGVPQRMGNRLVFTPDSFISESSGAGGADNSSGTLTMRIRADAGFFLELLRVKEVGDYTLTGIGTPATSANINGLLTATDIDPATQGVFFASLSVSPTPTYALPLDSFDEFDVISEIDLTGLGISEIALNFNNNLQTTSEIGTTAAIQKTRIEIEVPEPSSLALFLTVSLVLIRHQRQCRPSICA